MDDRDLAKLITQAGQDPGRFVGTASQMNADGTVTITGANGTVTAIAQTAFRSGNWSAKQVSNTWYAWSENSPVTESESKTKRKSRAKKKSTTEGLVLLVSVTQSDQEYFYALSDTFPIKQVAVLPVSSALAPAHLAARTVRGKREYLFSCIYQSLPNQSTVNTGQDLFSEPVHYTIKTSGIQNWQLNCYFDTSPVSSPRTYAGNGFWHQSTIVNSTTGDGFFSYAYSTKNLQGVDVPQRTSVPIPSSEGYLVAPGITKLAANNETIVSNLVSLDKKIIFYIKTTTSNSIIVRMRSEEELQVVKPNSMTISSLVSCPYKDEIYNFNSQIGVFIFGSSVSLDLVKSYGIRHYRPAQTGSTINYQEVTPPILINALKGVESLPTPIRVHSAFYG